MNDIAKIIIFLAVLVSDSLYYLSWAETFPPLNCSTSSVRSCDAYIYLRNVTEPIDSVASRFNISAQEITPFNLPDYLGKIRCSCLEFLGVEAFFYKLNYTVQPSDVGLVKREISDKYFSHTAWTEVNALDTYKAGYKLDLGLGCGCPIPGWKSIVSYAVPPGGALYWINTTFNSNFDDIETLNNITDPKLIRANRVYFIPYLSDGTRTFQPQPSSPVTTDGRTPKFQPPVPQPSLGKTKGPQESHHKPIKTVKVSLPIAGAILLLVLSIVGFYYGCRKRAKLSESSTALENGQIEYKAAQTGNIITLNGSEHKHEHGENLDIALSLPTLTNLTHDETIQMKSYCIQCYEIGEGSFGKVYVGNLKEKDVAIKKIKCTGKDSKKLIENEVSLLQGKKHKNIVSLIAWCIEDKAFYLVYEYVSGCTLDEYLRGSCAQLSLSWKQCLGIISSIAEGIEFLHFNRIIHVDIKPQNLMVDGKDNEVKIIDFGFSRDVDWEGSHWTTDRITGTRGYWAPEYCLNHKLSYKHDVYSFGIVALEVITGQKHVDNARGSSQFHIPDYVRYMMACNRFEQALDERIKGEGFGERDLINALAVANLALKCVEHNKEERPDMSYVMRALNSMSKENTEGNSIEIVS